MIFSPLLPTTYPPNPISSKSQKREVSESIGTFINVPTKTIVAKVSITKGRQERCNQFPLVSSTPILARACTKSRSIYCINFCKSVSNCFFSLAGRVSRSTNRLTASTTFVTGSTRNVINRCIENSRTSLHPERQKSNTNELSRPSPGPTETRLVLLSVLPPNPPHTSA